MKEASLLNKHAPRVLRALYRGRREFFREIFQAGKDVEHNENRISKDYQLPIYQSNGSSMPNFVH